MLTNQLFTGRAGEAVNINTNARKLGESGRVRIEFCAANEEIWSELELSNADAHKLAAKILAAAK